MPIGVVSLRQRKIAYKDGTEARMTRMEAALLGYLAERPGRVIGRDELLRDVWGLKPGLVHTRTVDMHMAMLRRKLREGARNPQALRTVNGQGYIFAFVPARKGQAGRELSRNG